MDIESLCKMRHGPRNAPVVQSDPRLTFGSKSPHRVTAKNDHDETFDSLLPIFDNELAKPRIWQSDFKNLNVV